jgi:predicted RNase H-like HicB family nuclease
MATQLPRQFQQLSEQVDQLTERLADLESLVRAPTTALIQSFAPEPYRLLQPIQVTIEPEADGFVASFFDANISASGETEQEAFENLKGLTLDIFDSLGREAPERLGPEPARQLAVLRSLIHVE